MCNPYAPLACGQSCSISQLPYVMFGILSPLNLLNVCVAVTLKIKNKKIAKACDVTKVHARERRAEA